MSIVERFGGKTVYMIFIDRFAIGDGKTSAERFKDPAFKLEYFLRDWSEPPETPPKGRDYFGGNLQGIIDRLDYLKELGVDIIYLTPIFKGGSNHKYDVSDHSEIDPMFGDFATLALLINGCERRGMQIVLDIVVNHVGDTHSWFVAAKEGDANLRDYFYFREDGSYSCWWDFRHLPELNIENPELRAYFYKNRDSILKRYLDLGIAGWRFDTAPDLGLPYTQDMRRELESSHPDSLLLGELTCFASAWVGDGTAFHGATNYVQRDALLHWLRGMIESQKLQSLLRRSYEGYGHDAALCSWNIISSHDQPRLRRMLPDRRQRQLLQILQFTLPGCPTIYYGDEIGMDGGPDPDCRRPMIWDENRWDREELAFYQRLAAIRRERPELRHGRFELISDQTADPELLLFLRHTDVPEEVCLIAINAGNAEYRQLVLLPYAHFYDGVRLQNLLGSEAALRINTGFVQLNIPAHGAVILAPQADQFNFFRFYKPRAAARSNATLSFKP